MAHSRSHATVVQPRHAHGPGPMVWPIARPMALAPWSGSWPGPAHGAGPMVRPMAWPMTLAPWSGPWPGPTVRRMGLAPWILDPRALPQGLFICPMGPGPMGCYLQVSRWCYYSLV